MSRFEWLRGRIIPLGDLEEEMKILCPKYHHCALLPHPSPQNFFLLHNSAQMYVSS